MIELLDCTLRDGGHVVNGQFGKKAIEGIANSLIESGVDILEMGFLWQEESSDDYARFHSIAELKKILPSRVNGTKISLMADNVDLGNLEVNDGTVEFIRLSFRKNEMEWAEKQAKILKNKGYKVFFNPIHGSSISDEEYIEFIKRINKIHPYGFSIVDTFGALKHEDLTRLYYILDNNLSEDISIGIHLHANLGLAFSLMHHLLQIASPKRHIIIDASLLGMGKVPGNLCMEQAMKCMNDEYDRGYSLEAVYDAIDQYISPIRDRIPWGYSLPYAISAQCKVHRTYAEYLFCKERLKTKDIKRLMEKIDFEHAEIFDEKYIEKIYNEYMNVSVDDENTLTELKNILHNYKRVIVVAPGKTIKHMNSQLIIGKDVCLISVNFVYNSINDSFVFATNTKRLHNINLNRKNIIITSNLLNENINSKFVINRNDLVYHKEHYCEDSTLMLINLLYKIGITNIEIAGFDGFIDGQDNFYRNDYEHILRDKTYSSKKIKRILDEVYCGMHMKFITPSIYEDTKNDKIYDN